MVWLGIVIIVVLVTLGVPLYISIFASLIYFFYMVMEVDPVISTDLMMNFMRNYILIAVPLFLLAGQLIAVSGALPPLLRVVNAFLGHIPGGPAYVLIVANIAFAAMSGVSLGAIAAFAPIMIPIMQKVGYSKSFAVGLLISCSILANLIPPAIIPIFYAYITETSVIDLWTAGIVLGLITAFFLGITVYIETKRTHIATLPRADWTERWQAVKEAWPILLTPAIVLVPLYAGWATPTEVAAISVFYIALVGVFFFRQLNLRIFFSSLHSTVSIVARIFAIIMVALLLNKVLTHARIPFEIGDFIADMGLNWWAFMGVMTIFFLIMGMLLDPSAMIIIAIPLLLPTMASLAINKIAFGVFTVFAIEIAGITPPYGLVLFGVVGILNLPYIFVAKACIKFYPALVAGMVLAALVPQLSTWLPDLMR